MSQKKTKVIRWLRTHGERYTPEQVAHIWNLPRQTVIDWLWIADINAKQRGGKWAQGLSMRLASVPLTNTTQVLRQIRRERKAADRTVGARP